MAGVVTWFAGQRASKPSAVVHGGSCSVSAGILGRNGRVASSADGASTRSQLTGERPSGVLSYSFLVENQIFPRFPRHRSAQKRECAVCAVLSVKHYRVVT